MSETTQQTLFLPQRAVLWLQADARVIAVEAQYLVDADPKRTLYFVQLPPGNNDVWLRESVLMGRHLYHEEAEAVVKALEWITFQLDTLAMHRVALEEWQHEHGIVPTVKSILGPLTLQRED